MIDSARSVAPPWDLWCVRALFPDAGPATLVELQRGRQRVNGFETDALLALHQRAEELFAPGRRFLAAHPEISSGLVVTMHIGPYQFLPEPYLHAGIEPAVLLNRKAFERLRPEAERLRAVLDLAGRNEWIPIDTPFFVRRIVKAIRQHRPVLVFLDGNSGWKGSDGTYAKGARYRLPGREITIRTGLARLIRRLRCPVHPVVIRWDEGGGISWQKGEFPSWDHACEPERIARALYDWGFGEVLRTPEQWGHWGMLKESFVCFAPDRPSGADAASARQRERRRRIEQEMRGAPDAIRLHLDKDLEIWPGDVLANLTDDFFFAAEGLRQQELDELRSKPMSLAELSGLFDERRLRFQVLRLCLLGLAHLEGPERGG